MPRSGLAAASDRQSWADGYAEQAAAAEDLGGFTTLGSAEKLAAAFIDPLLAERAPGAWDPTALTWR